MSASPINPLPLLTLADFGPGMDHVAETYLGGKIFAILHKDDPARTILPTWNFSASDWYTYVVIHGSAETTRFEDQMHATHEIPVPLVAQLIGSEYGPLSANVQIKLCTCYGNLIRPNEPGTLAEQLLRLLPDASMEAYHGIIRLEPNRPYVWLGSSVEWDANLSIPVLMGPPGNWERVSP